MKGSCRAEAGMGWCGKVGALGACEFIAQSRGCRWRSRVCVGVCAHAHTKEVAVQTGQWEGTKLLL